MSKPEKTPSSRSGVSQEQTKVTVRIERRVSLPNYEHEIISVMADTHCADDDRDREVSQARLYKMLKRTLMKQVREVRAEG